MKISEDHFAIVVDSLPEHAQYLAPRLRDADKEEIRAGYDLDPLVALRDSLELSTKAWTGVINDKPVCMFGVSPLSLLHGEGSPWFVATPEIERHAMLFLRRCTPCVERMAKLYPNLENWVDARNTKAIRWLRWLGFEIEDPAPWGAYQLPFHHFSMRAQ